MAQKENPKKESVFLGSAYALVVILLILSAMASYMLFRLYQISSQLAESNRRTFVFEVQNKKSILQKYFAERIYDLERFIENPVFQAYFERKAIAPSNEQAMKIISGQLEQELLVNRLRIEKQGKAVYARFAFYDLQEDKIVARTDFSPKGQWINEELFAQVKDKVSESLNLVSVCVQGECRVLLIGSVPHRGRPKGILLMELTAGVIRDQVQLLSLQKTDNFTGLADVSGRLILGPEKFAGLKTHDLFGLAPEEIGKMKSMAPSSELSKITGEKLVIAGGRIPGIKFYLVQVDRQSKFIGSHAPALWTLVFVMLMIALALVLTHIFKSYAERQVMYRSLQEAHDNLEQRVDERTAELVEVNDRLRMEVLERRKAEDALKKAGEELRSVNRDLEDFAYVVSHDLKAPLRSARQILDWIREDYMEKLDQTGYEYLDLLTNRLKLMHNLIEGILKYSRVGRSEDQKEIINIQAMVKDIVGMISPPSNIEIVIEDNLPNILSETTLLHEIFQNLIDNAIKYMDKTQGVINIGCIDESTHWVFKVADNGPGIEEGDFDNIFKIFKTLSKSDDIESTGIGLALVKKIVERKGGRIWVESKPGSGSTFIFSIPKAPEDVEPYMKGPSNQSAELSVS